MKKKVKINFATLDDVPELIELEKTVWGDNGANREKLISRIKTFRRGNIIALYEGRIVGYLAVEYVDNVAEGPGFTWDKITDNGTIVRSHNPKGNYVYGINLSVHSSMNGSNVGMALMLRVWANMIEDNKRGGYTGSRIPGFANYKKYYSETTAEEYIKLLRNGKPRDYELKMYAQDGLLPVKVLPNYFPDPESLNYGVLVYRHNPFYNWPLRFVWAYLIAKAPIYVRSKFGNKKKNKEGDLRC